MIKDFYEILKRSTAARLRLLSKFLFYRLFEEMVGIGLPLMEEVNAESELSLRFELWGVRKSHS